MMQVYIAVAWIFAGWILPFYISSFIEDRKLSIMVFSLLWMMAFGYVTKNRLAEPSLLLRSKMQAYKELLREVSIHWYNPQ
jgi:hypothetical protein